jgi:hypothetical protein
LGELFVSIKKTPIFVISFHHNLKRQKMTKVKTTPIKYQQLRQQTETERSEEVSIFEAEQSKCQLEADISKTKLALSEKRRELTAAKRAFPFDVSKCFNLDTEIKRLEEGVAYATALKDELF